MTVVECPHLVGFDPPATEAIDDPYPSWVYARARAGVVYVPLIDRYVAVS